MSSDPILFWNEVALEVHRRDFSMPDTADGKPADAQQAGPAATARALAIVHIAMYDAWNAATGTGKSYLGSHAGTPSLPPVPAEAAAETAVAGAAAGTLRALFTLQGPYIEARMGEFCASLPASLSGAKRRAGLGFGAAVAKLLIKHRSTDGSDAKNDYVPGMTPGEHRPDPLNPEQKFLGPKWGEVTPFCIPPFAPGSNTSGYLPAPPKPGSTEYDADFVEVRDHGARSRGKRTAQQELTGLYWAYDGSRGLGTPPRLYNQIARTIASDQKNDVATNARLFALINAGMADAGIVAWRAKYEHALWRPVLGVRENDLGTGPSGLGSGSADMGDPAWQPYGSPRSNQPGKGSFTPNFPAYPSGHATFGATVFALIASFYKADRQSFKFDFVSDELNGLTVGDDGKVRDCVRRRYSLSEAINDNLESRVWLGVHWRFDGKYGVQAGETVATAVLASDFK